MSSSKSRQKNTGSGGRPSTPVRNLASQSDESDSDVDIPKPLNAPVHNWQSHTKCLAERFEYALRHQMFTDVVFVVGSDARRFAAHKLVLSLSSVVFDALFNGEMATCDAEIVVTDIESDAFHSMLTYIYTEKVRLDPDSVMATLYVAKKYIIPSLENECVSFLRDHLLPDNSFTLLMQARIFDEPKLAQLCLDCIDTNTIEAMSSECFSTVDRDTLLTVMQRDTLGISECRLFTFVCQWAEATCVRTSLPLTPKNLRDTLGPALYLLRFPLMTPEEFSVEVMQKHRGLLTDKEAVDMYLYFTTNPKPNVPFSLLPRCCITGRELVISRFCKIESRWGYSGTSDRIRFQVNRKINIVGFGLYGGINGPSEYECLLQIMRSETSQVLAQNEATFKSDGSQDTFRVVFKEPVEIMPNFYYTASVTLKGPDSYYGTKGLRKVNYESVSGGKVVFTFSYAAGNNNGTSVEDGQIPEIYFYV